MLHDDHLCWLPLVAGEKCILPFQGLHMILKIIKIPSVLCRRIYLLHQTKDDLAIDLPFTGIVSLCEQVLGICNLSVVDAENAASLNGMIIGRPERITLGWQTSVPKEQSSLASKMAHDPSVFRRLDKPGGGLRALIHDRFSGDFYECYTGCCVAALLIEHKVKRECRPDRLPLIRRSILRMKQDSRYATHTQLLNTIVPWRMSQRTPRTERSLSSLHSSS